MKIKCLHGYFIFQESSPGEISKFMSLFKGLTLDAEGDYYTFSDLVGMPKYSIEGADWGGVQITKTFEGQPWQVFEQNDLIYDFNSGKIKLITSVTDRFKISLGANVFLADGLILPGSLTDAGERVKDYSAWLSFDTLKFKYSEVTFV